MARPRCKRCRRELEEGGLRYVARVDLYAAYDALEITAEDFERDHREEIRQLLMKLADEDTKEMEDEIFMRFKFDLCKDCKERLAGDLSRGEFPWTETEE